ncbi:MAG: ribosomal protein S18-alanine N-acetyltransferase [Desulfobacterales bacterium]
MWRLHPITEADIDQILAIERHSFEDPWPRMTFVQELSNGNASNYAVRHHSPGLSKDIIGYICFQVFSGKMHISKVAVALEWRGQGIASWLINACLKRVVKKGARAAFLEVRGSSISAVKLYLKLGFDIVEKRKNYYLNPKEDALVMMKILKEGS